MQKRLASVKEKRQFYRHPIHAPLHLSIEKQPDPPLREALDISMGGLCFFWHQKLSRGSVISIFLTVKNKTFEIKSRVVYTREDRKSGKFRTGVRFVDYPSAFTARLAEEALEILEYRKTISRQLGHEISEEEAAMRWIREFGDRFSLPPQTP